MGLLTKWREKHPKKVDAYDAEEMRLQQYLSTLDVTTDEYDKAQSKLKTLCSTREISREGRRRFTKDGRASIWTKIIGGIGTLAGIGALGYYEMKGNTFTGEKRKLADGLTNLVTNLFKNR